MNFHPILRLVPATGGREWRCPYCQATAPDATPRGEWEAAHSPCQVAASLLTPEELFTTYVARKPC